MHPPNQLGGCTRRAYRHGEHHRCAEVQRDPHRQCDRQQQHRHPDLPVVPRRQDRSHRHGRDLYTGAGGHRQGNHLQGEQQHGNRHDRGNRGTRREGGRPRRACHQPAYQDGYEDFSNRKQCLGVFHRQWGKLAGQLPFQRPESRHEIHHHRPCEGNSHPQAQREQRTPHRYHDAYGHLG